MEPRRFRDEILRPLKSRRLALFLDYDGTLTPIVSRPEEARLSESVRSVLKALAAVATVAVISGRDRRDVETLVGIEGLIYAGSHGFDIAGPGDLRLEHEGGRACRAHLDSAERRLRARLDAVPGAEVERKRYSIAVHYRNVPDTGVDVVRKVVEGELARHRRLSLGRGKRVWELRPAVDWDKGKAVLWLLEALNIDSDEVLPVYVGDDVTDEDAFGALAGRGLTFFVGALR